MQFKSLYIKYKLVLWIAILTGLLAYSYVFIHEIGNPDKYFYGEYQIGGAWEYSLGRYLLPFMQKWRFGLMQPILTSTITIILFSISAVVFCEIIEIKWNSFAACIGLLIVLSPKLMATITCYTVSDIYAFAHLAVMFSVYWVKKRTERDKRGISHFTGSIVIALSLGIYQAVINELAVMSLIVIMLYVLNEEKNWVRKTIDLLLMDMIGVVLYYIIMKATLSIVGIPLNNYRGIGNFGILHMLQSLPANIIHAYQDFFHYFLGREIFANSFGLLKWNYIFLILMVLAFLWNLIFIKNWIIKTVAFVLLLILPAATAIMDVIVETSVDNLQTDGLILVLPFGIKVFELFISKAQMLKKKGEFRKVIMGCVGALALIVSYKYVLITNADAVAIHYSNRQAIEIARRIIGDYEAQNFPKDLKVDIIGVPKDGNYPIPEHLVANVNRDGKLGVMWNGMSSPIQWSYLISHELGIAVKPGTPEEISQIVQSEAFINAPCYPEKGSMFTTNDAVVVKVSPIIS